MLAECVNTFLDLETGELREVGERFETTQERFSAINSTKYGKLVKKVEEQPTEDVSEPQKPRRRTRKAKPTQE